MVVTEISVVICIIGILNGAQILYMNKLGRKIEKLSNGCFERHMKIAREEGANGQTVKALHRRLDELIEMVGKREG